MAVPGLWTAALIALPQGQNASDSLKRNFDEGLIVESRRQVATANPRVLRFIGNVKASYGPTVVTSDELTLFMDERRGEAIGHVALSDPEGQAQATTLRFDWGSKAGSAENVHALVEGVRFDARRIEISPNEWRLFDVSGTNSNQQPPVYLIVSKEMIIRPGRLTRVVKPSLYAFGTRVLTLKAYQTNLDQRTGGLPLPVPSYRPDLGFGVRWNPSLLVGPQTEVAFDYGTIQGYSASYALQISRTLLKPDVAQAPIRPRSELEERFVHSYFDNITVKNPEDDASSTRAKRSSVSLGTVDNYRAPDRDLDSRYYKPIDLAYEQSGPISGLGYDQQVRIEAMHAYHGPTYTRSVFQNTLAQRPRRLAKNVDWLWRVDANGYVGSTTFGWARTQLGVTYGPIPAFRAGASIFTGGQAGTSLFPVDELPHRVGYAWRADLNLGATKFSWLNKYDLQTHKLYDHEYWAQQAVGPFDVFLVYRRIPGDYHLGFRLRIDQFVEAIRRRNVGRRSQSP